LVVGHPFDTIKVRMQTQGGHGRFKGPLDCWRHAAAARLAIMDSVQMGSLNNFRLCLQGDDPSVKLTSVQQGIAGIGAAWSCPCLMFRSFFLVLWGSYDVYTNELNKMGVNSSMVPFFAGALAAKHNRIMTHPANLPRLTIREWHRGFYRGFLPSFLRSAPTNGAAVLVYETDLV
ncbi:mitochondrial carrier domain-containing protein, partial [Entophlyctis helioformis]